MKKGLLSVVMVNFNHARFIEEAIRSIISQTYDKWELVIVDDGSKDGSLDIIRRFSSEFPGQIKVLTHSDKLNRGISASYALGIGGCEGEFVGFLEPDDLWTRENAKLKIEVLAGSSAGAVYSAVEPFGSAESLKEKQQCLRKISRAPENAAFNAFPKLLFSNIIPGFSACIVRKDLLSEVKFLTTEEYPVWLDWFFWFQLSRRTKFLFLPERLVKWRLHPGSYCSSFSSAPGLKLFPAKIRFGLRLLEVIFTKPRSIA